MEYYFSTADGKGLDGLVTRLLKAGHSVRVVGEYVGVVPFEPVLGDELIWRAGMESHFRCLSVPLESQDS